MAREVCMVLYTQSSCPLLHLCLPAALKPQERPTQWHLPVQGHKKKTPGQVLPPPFP